MPKAMAGLWYRVMHRACRGGEPVELADASLAKELHGIRTPDPFGANAVLLPGVPSSREMKATGQVTTPPAKAGGF